MLIRGLPITGSPLTVDRAPNRQNQNDKRAYLILNQGFLLCHPEQTRRIFAVSIEKRFFVTSFLRMTKGESVTHRYWNPVSRHVILSVSEGSSQYRKRKDSSSLRSSEWQRERVNMKSMPKQGSFLCHPERQRRIFAPSKVNRFFVTAFLRMTKGG